MKHQDRKDLLVTVAMAPAVICIVVLFFFRTSILKTAFLYLLEILMPFIYGAVIAYLLRPVCLRIEKQLVRWFDKKGTGRHSGLFRLVSILLSLVLLLVLLLLLLMAVLPELIRSISALLSQLPSAVENFQSFIHSLDNGDISHEIVSSIETALDTLSDKLTNFLQSDLLPTLQTLVSGVTSSFMDILGFLKNFGLGCIISAYILGSWEKFAQQLKLIVYALFPHRAADWIRSEARFTDRMFSGFISGKLLDSLIIGILCFIFCLITKMPYASLVSIIVGVTNIIPFFGPYLGAIPSALLVLTLSPGKCVLFVVFIILLQQLDRNLLGPAIIGDKLGLSGFWILFSILFFGSLWGIAGMLIGAPVFAVLYDLISKFIVAKLNKKGLGKMVEDYKK